ncbi:MAG: restriction endonuclease, partial [Bacteroidales bacterium]|nr:restriction endonuclease [Bacteroidales bacterium]
CGANKDSYGGGVNRESYAYPFIHDNFEKEFGNMKFDVIIGNPPYQLEDGGESTRSSAIYDLFINKSLELSPKYITMIIPSRWMTNNAAGISERWTKKILNDKRIKIMNDYESSVGLFNGVSVSGGVNYFLWDKTYNGPCEYSFNYKNGEIISKKINLNSFDSNILIRDLKLHSIIEKVIAKEGNYHLSDKNNFSYYVSPVSFFGKGKQFLTNWKGYKDHKSNEFNIKYYLGSKGHKSNYGWVKESQVLNGKNKINKNKVFIKAATDLSKLDGNVFYGEPNSVCSQTYLVIGHNEDKDLTKEECFNIISYISTKFFRLLLETKKTTQHGSRKVYQFVPLQDFSKPWTDEELYKKYKLTQEEIDYIEGKIATME